MPPRPDDAERPDAPPPPPLNDDPQPARATEGAAAAGGQLGEVVALLREIREQLAAAQVEALDATEAGRLCGVSNSKWRALSDRGMCPAPAELGDRCPRWMRSELLAWLRASCPSRVRWEQMKGARMKATG
jgi:predicted DNA-binding transcriptional regulator AlpA